MAHLKILDRSCEFSDGCSARATRELFDHTDELVGAYCSRHAQHELVALTANERTTAKADARSARPRKAEQS